MVDTIRTTLRDNGIAAHLVTGDVHPGRIVVYLEGLLSQYEIAAEQVRSVPGVRTVGYYDNLAIMYVDLDPP